MLTSSTGPRAPERSYAKQYRLPWLVAVTVGVASVVTPASAQGTIPDLQTIGSAFKSHRQALSSILIEAEYRGKNLADMEALSKIGFFAMPHVDYTLVVIGPKTYVRSLSRFGDGKPLERILAFDGTVLREKPTSKIEIMGKRHETFVILPVEKRDVRIFTENVLDYACYGIPDPGLRESGKSANIHKLPEMFSEAPFTVAPMLQPVDGAPCVVVESPGYQKLWLDLALGFAVRKREFSKPDGRVFFIARLGDFTEVLDGIWLPRRVERDMIGAPPLPDNYVGKTVVQFVDTVVRIEVNRSDHETFFGLKPTPGTLVLDQTLTPTGRDGKPLPASDIKKSDGKVALGVNYVQPADNRELDSVVSDARALAGESMRRRPGGWSLAVFAVFNAIAAIVILVVLKLRRGRQNPQV